MKGNMISIIIPCRNGTNYLTEAVAGIRRQNTPTEIIVVDDGSTDATADMACKLGCVVIGIPHSGLSAARNVGLKHAHGDFILFHDHDDIMRDEALQRLSAAFEQNEGWQIIMAQAMDFISPELNEVDKKRPRKAPYYGLLSGAVLIRREVFDAIDAFTEDLATGQTMDFIMRAQNAGISIGKIDFVAVNRRLHNNNMGQTMQKQEYMDYASILRMNLQRRQG